MIIGTLEPRVLLASFGPDLRFGDEGVVPAAGDVAIDALPGGQLLLIGTERIPPIPPDNDDNGNKTTLARVNDDGSFDPAFGTGGKIDLGETNGAVYNGSRVYVTTPGFDFAELLAYTPQGQLDTAFSGDGRMPVPFANPGGGTVSFVFGRPDAALDDGDVLLRLNVDVRNAAQETETFTQYARLNPDGSPDTSFGSGGFISFPQDGPNFFISPAAGGQFYRTADNDITRLEPDGETVDMSFADNGTLALPFPAESQRTLDDGSLLLIRRLESGVDARYALFRFNPDGAPDASFGNAGMVELPNPDELVFFNSDIAIDAAQRIVVTAFQRLFRFSADGQLENYPFGGTVPAGGKIFFDAEERILFGHVGRTIRFDALDSVVVIPAQRTLYVNADTAHDVVNVRRISGDRIEVSLNGQITRIAAAGIDELDLRLDDGANHATVTLDLPTSVTAGRGADTITTGAGNDTIDANRGENLIDCGDGNDRIEDSSINSFNNEDDATIQGGNGDKDISLTTRGNLSITLGTGDSTVRASQGDDTVTIAGGNNDVTASGGQDTIVIGGTGRNTILVGVNTAPHVTTGDGDDTFQIHGWGTFIGRGGNDLFDVRLNDFGGPIDASMGDGNDRFLINPRVESEIAATVRGGSGNDVLQGGAGAQTFFGDAGDDSLFAGDGDNSISGGDGNDSIRTGTGRDTIFGDGGVDTVKAGPGNDRISGGAGRDKLFGQQGNDRLSGTNHSDALDGGPGDDTLLGMGGNDKLFGGADSDLLEGGADDDRFFAADGEADEIFGGTGDDQAAVDELLDTFSEVETIL